MAILKNPELERQHRAVRLALTSGLALLFLAALLSALMGMNPAHADPGMLFVDGQTGSDDSDCSDRAAPCATIGYALNYAGSGDEIRVAQGTYTENVTIVDGETVTLRGGYTISGTDWLPDTGETIVDGNGVDRTFMIHGNDSVLENLTITGGDTPDGQCWGGGVWVTNGDVTIRNCLVAGNWADCSGAGIEVNSDLGPAHLTLVDSTVRDNQSGDKGGGITVWGSRAHLTNTRIISNMSSDGSALKAEESYVVIQDSTVADNYGDTAIRACDDDPQPDVLTVRNSTVQGNDGAIWSNGLLTITNSTIEDNTGDDWAVWSSDRLMMDDCIIRRNSTFRIVHIRTGHAEIRDTMIVNNDNAAVGGDTIGIGDEPTTTPTVKISNVLLAGNNSAGPTINGSSPNGSITLMNLTVAGNSVSIDPILAGNGTWTVTNSIVWGNTTPGDMLGLGTLSVSHSDVEGGWTGTGNIQADPQFVDASSGDYHLQAWSPCIDSGTADGAPDHDLDGVIRPQNAGYDMGAYEFEGTPVQNEGTRYVAASGSDAGPNLCLDHGAPCATVGHAVSLVNGGESILVAGGTYTENLSISTPVTLSGGYESTGWTRDLSQYESVILNDRVTTPAEWDSLRTIRPAVIRDGTELSMWYDGYNLDTEVALGLATSTDGLSWTKSVSNPVLVGTPGGWDGGSPEHGAYVIKEEGIYKIWYEGSSDYDVRHTGYATSTDGIDWHEYPGNPVIQAGPENYDEDAAGHGSVMHEDGTYKRWYHALGRDGATIAYATAPDEVTWTKQGQVLLPQPGEWDGLGLWGPSVLKLGGTYWMWYAGVGPLGPPAIGVVTSTDGISWTRFLTGPVMFEDGPIGDPMVISGSGKLRMWYSNYDQGTVNYAESDDGIAWTKSVSNPVLMPGVPDQWGHPVVRFESGSDGSILDGFTITGGSSQEAGGVDASQAEVTIRRCLIHDNFADGRPNRWGGGGVLVGSQGVTIEQSIITGNQAIQGASGVRVGEGHLTMVNTLVADNIGDEGLHINGSAALMNVTIAGNATSTGRPGINFNPQAGGNLEILNSIVYGNGDVIHVPDPGTVQVSYSTIENGWAGTGNEAADPQFVDAANGDYHLQIQSPCIDAGTAAGAPKHDVEGTPRDAVPDMGAYEWTGFHIFLPLTVRNFSP
jgi:hypothetical protein